MASECGEESRGEPGADRERRLFEILAAYFAAVEAGEAPDRTEWLARYPDMAEDIVHFLDDQDRLLKLTEPLWPNGEASRDIEGDPAREPGELTAGHDSEGSPPTDPRNGSAGYLAGTRFRYIGDYELLGEIARGGMGVVFRARQQSLNRPVALKMLLAGTLTSGEDDQRFRQEAEAAANLDHPNIVPVFEVGRHEGHSYFSMKLVEGGSLAQRLADFADQRASARLMAVVARAVHHAHQRGVLHRDLKPSNILLSGGTDIPTDQLEPHVTDFGLARRVEGDPGLTQSGAILGTPSYMAPEQASGKKGVVTTATDVYGMGAVLYAILSGKPPFQGDSVLETLAQVKERPLDPPSSHGRRVDRDLETICLKCLEKEPGRRYGSAEAVAEDLERWLAGVPIVARATGRAERVWRWCRRNAMATALVTTASLLVLAIVAGLLVGRRARQVTDRLDLEVRRRASLARRQEFVRDVKQASVLLQRNQLSPAIALLARHRPPSDEEDLRGFAWHHLWCAAQAGSPPLRGHRGDVYSATFSPDGKTLATASRDRTVRLWDVGERRTRLILPDRTDDPVGHTDEINWVAFSPDGKSLATASDDSTIKLWDAATGQLRSTLMGHHDRVVAVLFTHDYRHLISCGREGKVILWDLAVRSERSSFAVSNGTIQSLAVSTDDSILAIAGQRVVLWDLLGGRELNRFGSPDNQVNGVAFSHDGRTLASGGRDRTVMLWDAHGRQVNPILQAHAAVVQSVAFAPDDRTLASVDDLGVVHLWDTSSGAYDTLATGQDRVWCVTFSAEGRFLATTGGDATVKLWNPRLNRARNTIAIHPSFPSSMAFSASGMTLALVDQRGNAWTYEANRGESIVTKQLNIRGTIIGSTLSCDAAQFVTVDRDWTIGIWDFEKGRLIQAFTPSLSPLRVWVSPGGRFIATADTKSIIIVRDTATGAAKQFVAGPMSDVKFCPLDEFLAFSSWGSRYPTLWNFATGRLHPMQGLGHKGGTVSLAFSADGQLLATGGNDNTIVLWSCRSSQEVGRLSGHTAPPSSLAFSPCGRNLASGGEDRTVRLWDVVSQHELVSLRGHSGGVGNVAFSPDGLTLATLAVSAGGGLEVFLWTASRRE